MLAAEYWTVLLDEALLATELARTRQKRQARPGRGAQSGGE